MTSGAEAVTRSLHCVHCNHFGHTAKAHFDADEAWKVAARYRQRGDAVMERFWRRAAMFLRARGIRD